MKARKTYDCYWCRDIIRPGMEYVRVKSCPPGLFWAFHVDCWEDFIAVYDPHEFFVGFHFDAVRAIKILGYD